MTRFPKYMPPEGPPGSILADLHETFNRMCEHDRTVKSFNTKIEDSQRRMKLEARTITVLRAALRRQRACLLDDAADEIKKKHGIHEIPGFISSRDQGRAFWEGMRARKAALEAVAKAHLKESARAESGES